MTPRPALIECRDALRGANTLLTVAAVSSCTCNVKSPALMYHDAGCRYRLICEAMDGVDSVLVTLAAAEQQAEPVAVPFLYVNRIKHRTSGKWTPWEIGTVVGVPADRYEERPLYAHPQPAAEQQAEPVAWQWRAYLRGEDRWTDWADTDQNPSRSVLCTEWRERRDGYPTPGDANSHCFRSQDNHRLAAAAIRALATRPAKGDTDAQQG